MKAAVLYKPNTPLEVVDVDRVLVRRRLLAAGEQPPQPVELEEHGDQHQLQGRAQHGRTGAPHRSTYRGGRLTRVHECHCSSSPHGSI